jgi:hypothetical protein
MVWLGASATNPMTANTPLTPTDATVEFMNFKLLY